MQRFSLDRRRFAGHPRRGFPHPSGGSPSPPKAPQRGVIGPPQGAGACRPPVRPLASPSTPLGHPYGVPPAILAGSPSRLCSAMEGVGKRSAQGRNAPERGWKKNQSCGADCGRRPPAVEMWGRWGSRWAGVGAAGGQPPGCPRGVPASVHGPAKPPTGRVAISTSPPPGGPTRPPSGGLDRKSFTLSTTLISLFVSFFVCVV